jgi:TetR/AcrR family transcriptional regulator, regulator of biofilm formation and stress response
MPGTGTRAEASKQVRDAIVEATIRVVARDGVSAVTHRRIAAEAGVSLSSTTWHFATKADILEVALEWAAQSEVERMVTIADRIGDGDFDPEQWADALADWIILQVTDEREAVIALYRLQIELLGSEVHHEWGEGLHALGERVLAQGTTATPEIDIRLVIAALDGLRLGVLMAGRNTEWVRPAVHRQLLALFG